ncbi:hypothetical protein [Kitasatospora sp. GP82]|uniref:hypothetical protein n=1 Tax=Kitasatospora sp. GP82 TaxID=3035089 RepID=UPI00247376DA|nr:hypothetical protein [Kitasatospora sp. GP82]MDH6126902.1 hypothetical protein [Kitasatospora sp. GP82]
MTVTPDAPHGPCPEPEDVDDFWARPRPWPAAESDAFAELAQEMRQARLDAAIPLKADDADHLIDWPRVKRATARLKRAVQAWPNLAAAGVALVGPAWAWRGVVADCSRSFAPAADVADPGLCLGLMALAGVLVVRRMVRGTLLAPVARVAAWSVVIGTLAYAPARQWAAALLIGVVQ